MGKKAGVIAIDDTFRCRWYHIISISYYVLSHVTIAITKECIYIFDLMNKNPRNWNNGKNELNFKTERVMQ